MAAADTNKFENLPWELLEKIVERLPVPDVLRLKQVNRSFHDLIRNSLRVQHKLDLCAAGLELNWAAGVTVADSIKALEEYRSRWVNFTADRNQKPAHTHNTGWEATAGGVYGIDWRDHIQFFTLPSNTRGIQPITQTVQVGFNIRSFAFHPQEDVVIVAQQMDRCMNFHLLTISGGAPHPLAHKRTLKCFTGKIDRPLRLSVLITGWRLASVVDNWAHDVFQLSVWNWRTGERVFVCNTRHYKLLGFLDDYRLAIKVSRWSGDDTRSRLLVLDVEGGASRVPIQTWFHTFGSWTWIMEAGGYKPSLQDVLHAPFYPDPSQRILALSLEPGKGFLVMRVETLLRLARERAGGEIQWEEWNPYLIETPLEDAHPEQHVKCWVSGFRLFRVTILWITGRCSLDVYDFSADARTRLLRPGGGGPRVMHPSVAAYRLPWRAIDTRDLSAPAWTMIVWSSE